MELFIFNSMFSDEHLLKEYHEFLLANKRKKTADIYLFLLQHFISYLHNVSKTLHTATSQDIQRYIATKKWSNVSKIMFITIIKTFYEKQYLLQIPVGVTTDEIRWRLERENQIRAILNYPLPHKEIVQKNKSLSLSSVKTLLDYAKKKNIDEYCLIYALFYFGCRKSELMYINPSMEINWKENYLKITAEKSKTHTERILYFSIYTKSILIHILKIYGNREHLVHKEDTFLNKIFYKYNKIVNMHLFPHQCRHTFATEQLKYIKGKINIDEVMAIQMLLGHKGSTTQIYTHYNIELKEVMLNHHYLQQI